MPVDILLLVLCAALFHASWNYLAKTIPSGAPFVWLIAVVMLVMWLPVAGAYVYLYGFEWSARNLGVLLISGVLHLVYFVVLQVGYQKADLSVVYPLARGSGPVFASVGAVAFLGEQVGANAVVGLCLVVAGVLLVAGLFSFRREGGVDKTGLSYGLVIGTLIAAYTVWDGYALRVAPVHLVAPTREISIVLGVIFGAKLLTEENFRTRLLGALLIVAGIVFLSQ